MTALERIRMIPGVTASGNEEEIRVNALDFTLVARRFGDGKWHFDHDQCSNPKASYHFTLRKLIHDALNP